MSSDAQSAPKDETSQSSRLDPVMARNIRALHERSRRLDAAAGLEARWADAITGFTGSLPFVYLHVMLFAAWTAVNLRWLPAVPAFDPTFVIMATFASVEAIFLSTFVLISQNRAARAANARAELDLQISLLAEHEITRLLILCKAIAAKLGLPEAAASSLEDLLRDTLPETVLDELDTQEVQSKA